MASSASEPSAAEPSRPRGPRPKLGTYTIHDVAALAGVSSVTASRYFNEPHKVSEKLRRRIDRVIQQTGYAPSQVARRLASGQGGVVGAVMQNVTSPTFGQLVQGMGDTLENHGLQLLLANSQYSLHAEERAIRAFLGWHPRALILTRSDHSPAIEAMLGGLRIPVVQAWEVVEGTPLHQVGFSQFAVGRMLAEHFLSQGAQRIRFALNGMENDLRANRRAQGYAQAMRDAGLAVDIWRSTLSDDLAAGEEAIAQFAREPAHERPRAIVFANDNMAIAAALIAPRIRLRIPQDCAIAGFGDVAIGAIIEPALTTVRTAPYEIGSKVAQTVMALLEHPPAAGQTAHTCLVDCELVIRASSRLAG